MVSFNMYTYICFIPQSICSGLLSTFKVPQLRTLDLHGWGWVQRGFIYPFNNSENILRASVSLIWWDCKMFWGCKQCWKSVETREPNRAYTSNQKLLKLSGLVALQMSGADGTDHSGCSTEPPREGLPCYPMLKSLKLKLECVQEQKWELV